MLAKRIIPCLDTKDGRLVKGVRFVDLVDHGDPGLVARNYYLQGADEICLLDISASSEARLALTNMVRKVARELFVPLSVGGGVGDLSDALALAKAGADKVVVNTAAVRNPDMIQEISQALGAQSTVVAIDVKREGSGFKVFIMGGKQRTNLDPESWSREVVDLGAGEILLTSIDADGTRSGYDVELLAKIRRAVDVPIIASGGAGKPEHFLEAIRAGADAVLAASLFHTGKMTIAQIKSFLKEQGVPIR